MTPSSSSSIWASCSRPGVRPGKELDQNVDVASGAEVVAQDRPVQSEPADPVAGGEVLEDGVLDTQPLPQLHAAT
jgi:hypothetical protein